MSPVLRPSRLVLRRPVPARAPPGGRSRSAARGEPDEGPQLRAFLAERGTSASRLIVDILASLDVEEHLRSGGLSADDVAALRGRLVEP